MDHANRPARVPAHVVLGSIAGLWLAYFVVITLRGWLVGLGLHDALLWRRVVVIAASMVITAAIWPLLRLLDPQRFWVKAAAVLLIALPASLALALINEAVFAPIAETATARLGERGGLRIRSDEAGNLLVDPIEQEADAPPAAGTGAAGDAGAGQPALTIDARTREDIRWRQLTDVALGRYFLLLAWAALYFALVNAEQARAAERREGEFRRAAKAAELRSLRYQVNPHFLFNTLNSLSALVLTGQAGRAERMIQTLSSFYRRSLAGDPTSDHSLAEEIEQQQLYLEIEAVRFPERLRVEIDLPAALADARVPGMILQPLVENSVRYAVGAVNRPVAVRIAASHADRQLRIEVCDDGPGSTGGGNGAGGFGIGLANVRDRLAARYGQAARLESAPRAGGGWRAAIYIPWEHHG